LLYYFAEVVKGSPVSDRAFEVGQRIGMAMLAVLMALALFNDFFPTVLTAIGRIACMRIV